MERLLLFLEIKHLFGTDEGLIEIELKSGEILFTTDLTSEENGFRGFFLSLPSQAI